MDPGGVNLVMLPRPSYSHAVTFMATFLFKAACGDDKNSQKTEHEMLSFHRALPLICL